MMRREHIPTEALLDYVEGRADAAAAARARAHLETGCADCAEEVRFWTRSLEALQADRGFEVPDHVRQRAFNLLLRQAPQPGIWERVRAVLRFDSRQASGAIPALAGARDAGGSAFTLLFEAGETRIDLLCEPAGEGWEITGQVLTAEPVEPGWRIAARSEAGTVESEADEAGEFRLTGLAPGACELSARTARLEVELPAIVLDRRG